MAEAHMSELEMLRYYGEQRKVLPADDLMLWAYKEIMRYKRERHTMVEGLIEIIQAADELLETLPQVDKVQRARASLMASKMALILDDK